MNFIHPPSQQVSIHCTNILVTSRTKEEEEEEEIKQLLVQSNEILLNLSMKLLKLSILMHKV
jgi:hypothetical protein